MNIIARKRNKKKTFTTTNNYLFTGRQSRLAEITLAKNQQKRTDMFNIRRKGNALITKSVTPATSTGRQLAKVLLDNIQLKAELEKIQGIVGMGGNSVARDFNPNEPIPAEPPIIPGVAGGIKKALETPPKKDKPLEPFKVIGTAETQRIESRAAKIKELDAKAIASQLSYKEDTRGFVYHTSNTLILPTGSPSERMQQLVGEENKRRIAAHQKPFLTYDEWEQADKTQATGTQSQYITIDHTSNVTINPRLSKVAPSYVVSKKYYVLRDNGVTYIMNNGDGNNDSDGDSQVVDNRIHILGKQLIEGQPASGDGSSVIFSDMLHPVQNLTEAEHADILKAKPSYADLVSVYCLAMNTDNVEMNFAAATKIW